MSDLPIAIPTDAIAEFCRMNEHDEVRLRDMLDAARCAR